MARPLASFFFRSVKKSFRSCDMRHRLICAPLIGHRTVNLLLHPAHARRGSFSLSLLVNRLKADFSFTGVSMQPSDTALKSSDH
jgi:hypothetical protein